MVRTGRAGSRRRRPALPPAFAFDSAYRAGIQPHVAVSVRAPMGPADHEAVPRPIEHPLSGSWQYRIGLRHECNCRAGASFRPRPAGREESVP